MVKFTDYEKGLLFFTYENRSIIIKEYRGHLIKQTLDKYDIKYEQTSNNIYDKFNLNHAIFKLDIDLDVDYIWHFSSFDQFLSGAFDARAIVSPRSDSILRIALSHKDANKVYYISELCRINIGTQSYIYPYSKSFVLRVYWQSKDVIAIYHHLIDNSETKRDILKYINKYNVDINKYITCVKCNKKFIPGILSYKHKLCPNCLFEDEKDREIQNRDKIIYEIIYDYYYNQH